MIELIGSCADSAPFLTSLVITVVALVGVWGGLIGMADLQSRMMGDGPLF